MNDVREIFAQWGIEAAEAYLRAVEVKAGLEPGYLVVRYLPRVAEKRVA